jgi:hypothetical protein
VAFSKSFEAAANFLASSSSFFVESDNAERVDAAAVLSFCEKEAKRRK